MKMHNPFGAPFIKDVLWQLCQSKPAPPPPPREAVPPIRGAIRDTVTVTAPAATLASAAAAVGAGVAAVSPLGIGALASIGIVTGAFVLGNIAGGLLSATIHDPVTQTLGFKPNPEDSEEISKVGGLSSGLAMTAGVIAGAMGAGPIGVGLTIGGGLVLLRSAAAAWK